jgi:type VI secretion system secreted protein Hcp
MRGWLKKTVAAAAVSGGVASAISAQADTFVKMDGIQGESVDAKHKDEIDVLAWSWGTSGRSGDKSGLELKITKRVDRSTPKLILAAANGDRVKMLQLSVSGTKIDSVKLVGTDCAINSVKIAQESENQPANEEVSVTCNRYTLTYQAAGGPITAEVK